MVAADAPGNLYQKRPVFEKLSSWTGPRGAGSTGGGNRMDPWSHFDLQQLLETDGTDPCAAGAARVARPVCTRPAPGLAIFACPGALSSMWPARRASALGSQVATHYEGAGGSHRQAVAPVELEGDGHALRGGLEDCRDRCETGGRLGVGASGLEAAAGHRHQRGFAFQRPALPDACLRPHSATLGLDRGEPGCGGRWPSSAPGGSGSRIPGI
jgi:hypothetical protein